jgi:4-amino-4-deoxy-L-arabinose transferase-like glycosyltransferase
MALAWLGGGSLLLSAGRGIVGDRLLEGLNELAVGAIAWAMLTFAAGFAERLYSLPFAILTAAAALVGARRFAVLIRGSRLPQLRELQRWERALVALLGVYVVFAVVATAAPVSSEDALAYHAAGPALFEAEHGLHELWWSWESYQPFSVEMLVLDGFLLWDDVQGAFAPLLLGLASLAAVVGAADRIAGRGTAVLAGAVFFAQPFMLWQTTSTFVEPGLALATALAAWNLWRFAQLGRTWCVVVAGLLAGGAAGMKYTGAALAVVLAAVAGWLLRDRLRPRHLLAFAVPAVALALPWYVKNAVQTGNPVYPLLGGAVNEEATRDLETVLDQYGHGRSPVDAVLLPVRLLGDGDAFDRGDLVSPLLFLFAPLTLLVRKLRPAAVPVWLGIAAYLAAWFVGSQQARFLVALMPVLALLAALAAVEMARAGTAGRMLTVTVMAAALVTGLGVSTLYASRFVRVAVGLQSEDEFLRAKAPYYEATEWANRNLPPDAHVLSDIRAVLYLERDSVTWTPSALPSSAGASQTRAFVREHGFTHALVFEKNAPHVRQAQFAGGRVVARVTAHTVTSRTLGDLGPPETVLVYSLEPADK